MGREGKAHKMFDVATLERLTDRRIHRKGHHRAWNARQFIAWDGEGTRPEVSQPYKMGKWEQLRNGFISGEEWLEHARKYGSKGMESKVIYEEGPKPQPYVLLANSVGDRITREEGLSTVDCLELILDTRRRNPISIMVGFGFTYDTAQILADLPDKSLMRILEKNLCYYQGYRIEYRPRKWLRISHKKTKRAATIFDVFGFFQSNFIDACEKYLGEDDPDLVIIREGKGLRDVFTWEELDYIVKYNATELRMLVKMMDILREDLHNVGIHLHLWHGPGAVASQVLRQYGVKKHMKQPPPEVYDAARYALAGGRFEHFYLGFHKDTVWEYDIRSAYPSALTRLPSLSEGTWEYTETFQPDSFGVWHIEYREHGFEVRDRRAIGKPQPLFCRRKNGVISFPQEVEGWYWTPEACLVPDYVLGGYVWKPATEGRPFSFVEDMYEQRRQYKAEGNPAERALKLILNSLYGKLAQTVGGKDGKPPEWHQLEWAGYITSYTRARIYKAVLTDPTAIIAIETDALFSTRPLDLDIGPGLGQWEETIFKNITYLQSGFYYATTPDDEIICRYRGLDRDRETKQPVGLPYRKVLDHLRFGREQSEWRTPSLLSTSTRFINIGLGLRTDATYRAWETTPKTVSLDLQCGSNKRYHLGGYGDELLCPMCTLGFNLGDCLHPLTIGRQAIRRGYTPETNREDAKHSRRRKIPWIDDGEEEEVSFGMTPSEYLRVDLFQ